MLEDVKRDLGATFNTEEYDVLKRLIDEVTRDALSISNREDTEENRNLLYSEIKQCVKELYLQRGSEGSSSFSDSGKSTTFTKPFDNLRANIVNSGKRKVF